jgi:hypothetical protein
LRDRNVRGAADGGRLLMCAKGNDKPHPDPEAMDRHELIEAILCTECNFPVDLTREYLQGLSDVKLQHIYAALLLHARKSR